MRMYKNNIDGDKKIRVPSWLKCSFVKSLEKSANEWYIVRYIRKES